MEILTHLIAFFSQYGYIAVFCVLLACGIGMPVPEDITLIAGGIICALSIKMTHYTLDVHHMVIVAFAGVLIGDSIMFSLGNFLGPKVTKIPGLRHIITPKAYAQIQDKVHRYGDRVLFIARFLPGLRAAIFVTAGISRKVSLIKFMLLDGSAALISVPTWVYLGYFFAYDIDDVVRWAKKGEFAILGIVFFVVICIILFKYFRKKCN